MLAFGTPIISDLVSGGAPSIAVTPGATVQPAVFSPSNLKQAVGGTSWPVVRRIVVSLAIVFDQAAAGGAAVDWDGLHRALDSLNAMIPIFGNTHNKDVYSGPVAKHICEFFSNGYRYSDIARAQIPSTDGDTNLVLYFSLPFANEAFIEPEDFMPWAGWLLNSQITVNVATATTIAAESTGAVTKAPCTIKAWIESYPSPEPRIPVMNQWNRYTMAASANATQMLLQNVGQPNGLSDALNGCRLNAVLELCNKKGLGGASTADNFTSVSIPDLGQDLTFNVDAFFTALRSNIGRRGPVTAIGAAAIHDGGGQPYTMAALPNGVQNDTNALYMPWRLPAQQQKLVNVVKWLLGNLSLTRTFTATPSSGTHVVITNEIRQLNGSGVKKLLDAASIPQSVRNNMQIAYANKGEGSRRGQRAVMPYTIPTRGA